MPLRLMLSDSPNGRDYVVAVIGPLDLPTSTELRGWLTKPAPGYRVVLDLSSLSPIPAECLDLIADARRELTADGHPLRVVAADQIAADAIRAVGIEDVVVDRRDENRLVADEASAVS